MKIVSLFFYFILLFPVWNFPHLIIARPYRIQPDRVILAGTIFGTFGRGACLLFEYCNFPPKDGSVLRHEVLTYYSYAIIGLWTQ